MTMMLMATRDDEDDSDDDNDWRRRWGEPRVVLLLISRRDVALCPIFLSNGDDDCTERRQMNKDKRRFITL